MILAGIDEAGYGPVLGPLVVGACAFEVPCDSSADLPCLWKLLRKSISKTRVRDGKKLHINDSKLVYGTSAGLKELERGVLTFAATMTSMPDSLEAFLEAAAPAVLKEMIRYPWYRPEHQSQFPLEHSPMSLRITANGLAAEMQRVKLRCVHLAAQVVCEGELNRMFDATRNKSSVLFSLAAAHLDALLRNYGDKDLVIICDRQGGRGHYGPLLRLMFEDWALEIVSEIDFRSEYLLTRNGHAVRVVFVEKAESGCMPVALASMLSKYLRESMMHRFNNYWAGQLPGVAPTAGYHGDGNRFLIDIQHKRKELGVSDAELIRSR